MFNHSKIETKSFKRFHSTKLQKKKKNLPEERHLCLKDGKMCVKLSVINNINCCWSRASINVISVTRAILTMIHLFKQVCEHDLTYSEM